MKIIELGKFTVKSDLLAIDPCYREDTLGVKFFPERGEWNSFLIKENYEDWGIRNSELLILHTKYKLPSILKMVWEKEYDEVGVDSGQAGFVSVDTQRHDGFYGDICHLTSQGHNAGTYTDRFGNGAVFSTSGLGDGTYTCFTACFSRLAFSVAARIHFLQTESCFMDVVLLQRTLDKNLPLIIEEIKTDLGKAELERRLKNEKDNIDNR